MIPFKCKAVDQPKRPDRPPRAWRTIGIHAYWQGTPGDRADWQPATAGISHSGCWFPSTSIFERHQGGLALRLDGQFGGQQALDLILRHMGAIDNVSHKLRSKRQRHVVAIEIAGALA